MPMVYAAFASLLLGAAVCFALGRYAPARLLGLFAAAVALIAAALVALPPALAAGLPPPPAAVLGGGALALDTGGRALAIALLGGGGVALIALAGAIAPAVRGFGGLFAWALVTLAAALLSLAAPPLAFAQPLAWAVLSLAGYAALRASGAADGEEPPAGLVLGLLASVLLAGGLLSSGGEWAVLGPDGLAAPGGQAPAPGAAGAEQPPAWPAALCGLLAALGIAASPPMAGGRAEQTAAPAPLGALVVGLAAPAAGLGWLLRVVAELPILPSPWALTLGLIGGLGALACGAGALGVRGLRATLAWVTAGQTAAVVAAIGLAGPLAALAGPGLLVALMLAAALGAVAVATLERTTGSDDYTAAGASPPRAAGAVWALAAAAFLGLPPLWSFWPRLWLLQAAQEQQPWLLAPLIAGLVLTTLAVLAPLARLLGGAGPAGLSWTDVLPAALAALPLLALGLVPGLAWAEWLQAVPFAPAALPVDQGAQTVVAAAGLALVALAAGALLARTARALPREPDEEAVQLAPDALGAALRPLAWLAHPEPLLKGGWEGLRRASEGLRLLMSLFEQRFYLLGVLAALLTIMLLMAQ